MQQHYGLAQGISVEEAVRCKYMVNVDGNGASDTLLPTLCAGSLTMLASIVNEWYRSRLEPYVHYLPVR